MAIKKRRNRSDPWEDRRLGADARFVGVVPRAEEAGIDASLGLQMISVRLPRELIEHLKTIALHRGIGYQPLMRDVLSRFARGELIEVLRQQTEIAELQRRRNAGAKPKAQRMRRAA